MITMWEIEEDELGEYREKIREEVRLELTGEKPPAETEAEPA